MNFHLYLAAILELVMMITNDKIHRRREAKETKEGVKREKKRKTNFTQSTRKEIVGQHKGICM